MKWEILFNKKILVEIAQGTLSMLIIALVVMIYFSAMFNNFSFFNMIENTEPTDYNISSTGYFIVNKMNYNQGYNESNCSFNMPKERTIILRMDDVQGFAWKNISINITNTVLSENKSMVLGVIPYRIRDDTTITKYLLSKIADKRIEIAQHGMYHEYFEFSNLTEEEAYSRIESGQIIFINALGTKPTTFIPPNNEYNENTTKALSKLGLNIISAKANEYRFDGKVIFIGPAAQTKESGSIGLISNNYILYQCNNSLALKNICIILIHPQDYVKDDKVTMDPYKYNQFVELLDDLDSLNATFSTFKDLVECK